MRFVTLLVLVLILPIAAFGQRKPRKAPPTAAAPKPAVLAKPINVLGIRPGVTLDSVKSIAAVAGVTLRAVDQDTVTNCFADHSVEIYVIDSIYCRLTYMRMSFLVEASTHRVRRFTITPRISSILIGKDDDVSDVLLLYFGQNWGRPEIDFDAPVNCFRWRDGNIQVRGYIRRGYPLWVLEG
jgi:hypothetical protein